MNDDMLQFATGLPVSDKSVFEEYKKIVIYIKAFKSVME